MPIFTDPVTGAVFYVPKHLSGYLGVDTSNPPPPPPPNGKPPPREVPTRPNRGSQVPAQSSAPALDSTSGSVVNQKV